MKKLILPTWLKNSCNILVIVFAVACWVITYVKPDCKRLLWVITCIAALLCLIYLIHFIRFWLNIPKFDWHLIFGNYLWKVIGLVLLMPFLLTVFIGISQKTIIPQDMVYDENLYLDNASESVRAEQQVSPPLIWSVIYHFIDPGNQHMTTTKNGRGWAAMVAMFGVFLLNGLLVSSIVSWFDSRREKWLKGDVRYDWFLKHTPHLVIIGGNDMVGDLIQQLLGTNNYILIQISADVESFRRKLFSELSPAQQQRIIIYYGDMNSQIDIEALCLETAELVYILGEDVHADDTDSNHDTVNMKCIGLIGKTLQGRKKTGKKLVCRVMFEYQTSFNVLQVTDLDGEQIEFRPFNYYEMWAQKVLVCQAVKQDEKCKYLPLEGFEGIKEMDDCFVHLVIVGMSRMGIAMAIEAAHLAHYPNYSKRKTKITFIDSNMEANKHFFMGRFKEMFSLAQYRDVTEPVKDMYVSDRYPWHNPMKDKEYYLGKDVVDLEWEFINAPVEHPEVQNYLADAARNNKAKLTLAICFPEANKSIATAVYLPDIVYESPATLQLLVYQRLSDDLLMQLNQNTRYNHKLKSFGMTSTFYDIDLVNKAELISKELDVVYNEYMSSKIKVNNEGKTQKEERLPLCQNESKPKSAKMWSNQYNILTMWTKFRCVNNGFDPFTGSFDKRDLPCLGKMEHNRWVAEQLLMRYRPLSKQEQDEAKVESLSVSSENKKKYKKQFAHLDICSNERLNEVDYNISELDIRMIEVLPEIYRKYFN